MSRADDEGFGPALGGDPRGGSGRPPRGFDDDYGPALGGEGARSPRRSRTGRGAERDDFGPPVQGRRRVTTNLPRPPRVPRPSGRVVRTIFVLLLTLALFVLGAATALAVYATITISRVQVAGLAPISGGIMNVLVVGSDSREGLTPEQLQALGTDAVQGQRTDSIFLLSARGGSAAVLSLPRDLYVTRCDGSNGRINGAFANSDGASCLVDTVTQETGIGVTHYLQVDFAGFVDLVDAVGGISVFLEQPMVDESAGVNLPQGCNLLDGRQALGFVRARKVDSDLGRIARQQRFIAQLAGEIAEPATVVNPLRLFQITSAASNALTADQGLGVFDLIRLARAGRGLAAGGLATYTVPTTADRIDDADVLVPTDEADALYASFRDGSVLDVPAGDVAPSDFTVDVLNGAGIEGLAARGRDELTERGFQVGQVGNADPVAGTVVRHRPGFEAAAQLVAQQFPGIPVEPVAEGDADVALVVGPDGPTLFDAPTAPPPAPGPEPTEPAPGPATPGAIGAGPVPETCS